MKLIRIVLIIAGIATLFAICINIYLNTYSTRNTWAGDKNRLVKVDSTIKVVGDIEYKHIFSQVAFDTIDYVICLPFDMKSKNDSSLFLANLENDLSITKFKIAYDSCTISPFNELVIKPWKYTNHPQRNHITRRDTAALEQWKLNIDKIAEICNDTDHNKVRIGKDASNYIEFSQLYNVIIEELDMDKDGLTEIYLFSYFWCQCQVDVYRVNAIGHDFEK